MDRDEAISSLHRLAGLMQLQGKTDHARRLHRRAVLAEVTPVTSATALTPYDDDAMEAKFGVQVEVRDERVLPPAIASLVGLAELHASREQYDEAIRVVERIIELEEKRVGVLDERLAPHLVSLAHYVELSGNIHEANSIKQRAFAISDAARPAVDREGARRSVSKSLRQLAEGSSSGSGSPSRTMPGTPKINR
jgi:hypothetical protein